MFADKFILPYQRDLKKLKTNHGIALFMISKKAFV